MKPYHYAWLSAHRNRTEEWLRERLADGFDIHHADGDHFNDDPANLVLIEGADHMRLHGSSLNRLLAKSSMLGLGLGEVAYVQKDAATSWTQIGLALKPDSANPSAYARSIAKAYADKAGLPFPKPGSNIEDPKLRVIRTRKKQGANLETALACRALLHRLEPYS